MGFVGRERLMSCRRYSQLPLIVASVLLLGCMTSIGCIGTPKPPTGSPDRAALIRTGIGEYTVRRGDTWRSIADRFGIPMTTIRRANPQFASPPVGHAIEIPRPKPEIRAVHTTAEGTP